MSRSSDAAGSGRYNAVFFDLDGTLVDTAPDMVAVLERVCANHNLPTVDRDLARNNVSNGSVGLLRLAFPDADDAQMKLLVEEFLDDYQQSLCIDTHIFEPLGQLLETVKQNGRTWGVVTNKPARMTDPLLKELGIYDDAAAVVSGDTLPQRKPHPAPLLHAAEIAGVTPAETTYVGDASRDIEAGIAAGMGTIAVGFGYIAAGDDPQSWGADLYAADTIALVDAVEQALGIR